MICEKAQTYNVPFHGIHILLSSLKFLITLLGRWLSQMRVNKNHHLVTISQFCLTNRRLFVLR